MWARIVRRVTSARLIIWLHQQAPYTAVLVLQYRRDAGVMLPLKHDWRGPGLFFLSGRAYESHRL
jgi:hypothetical protein